MKIVYVVTTWALTNLLHPFVVWIYFSLFETKMGSEFGEIAVFYGLFGFLFSFPALFMAIGIMAILAFLPIEPKAKFGIWLLLATATPIFTIYLFSLGSNLPDAFELVGPATISLFLIVLIRTKSFFKLFIEEETQMT